MDRTQAAAIKKHMLDAGEAMDRAWEIIFDLEKEDRAVLSVPLKEIVSAHFDLLDAVYIRHPDLRPPSREIPIVNTVLRWEDIALPESVSEADLDSIIFRPCFCDGRRPR